MDTSHKAKDDESRTYKEIVKIDFEVFDDGQIDTRSSNYLK